MEGDGKPNINTGRTWQLLGTYARPTYYTLMQDTVLGDRLIVAIDGGVVDELIVTLITIRGVGGHTDRGYRFVKWYNVYHNNSASPEERERIKYITG